MSRQIPAQQLGLIESAPKPTAMMQWNRNDQVRSRSAHEHQSPGQEGGENPTDREIVLELESVHEALDFALPGKSRVAGIKGGGALQATTTLLDRPDGNQATASATRFCQR